MPAADRPLVLDGEVVSLDPSGRPSFQQLQQRMNLAGGARIAAARTAVPVVYVVFDVLYDGEEVIAEPWERRRRRLESLDLQFPLAAVDRRRRGPDRVVGAGGGTRVGGHRGQAPNLGVPTRDEVHRVAEDHPLPDGAGGGGRLASRRTGESRYLRVPPPRSVDRPTACSGWGRWDRGSATHRWSPSGPPSTRCGSNDRPSCPTPGCPATRSGWNRRSSPWCSTRTSPMSDGCAGRRSRVSPTTRRVGHLGESRDLAQLS